MRGLGLEKVGIAHGPMFTAMPGQQEHHIIRSASGGNDDEGYRGDNSFGRILCLVVHRRESHLTCDQYAP